MNLTQLILVVLGVIMLLWLGVLVVQAAGFARYVRRELGSSPAEPLPRATVLLPCKGVDKELGATLAAVRALDYPAYEIICAVESATDPAYSFIQNAARSDAGAPMQCVVAETRSERCSQKISNLLAALQRADPRSEVIAFLDSDAIPPPRWLRAMVGPLGNEQIGAVTGFRWYVPGRTFVGLVRCAWNNVALSVLGGQKANFCWGGSIAMRRDRFEHLQIAQRWQRVLSEDFEITRAVCEAGLQLQFAPGALLPSDDDSSWTGFWTFARRQLIITRICHPTFWVFAATMTVLYAVSFWGLLAVTVVATQAGQWTTVAIAGGLTFWLYALGVARGAIQQVAVRQMLGDPRLTGLSDAVNVWTGPLVALLNTALVVASGISNQFWWRGIWYQMRAVDDVRVLARRDFAVAGTQDSRPRVSQ